MTKEKVDKQRDVVRNERRQSYEDAPYGEGWLVLPELLYPPGHPYAHSVIGSHADLEAASVDDVVAFFNRWYVPNNASLVIAGDFEPAQIKPQVEQLFGGLEARTLPTRIPAPAPDKPQKALVEVRDQVDLPKTMLVWHSPAALQPGDAAMEFVADILGAGRASRLHRALVEDKRLATEASAAQYGQLHSGIFMIEALPAEGGGLQAVEDAVMAEIQRLATEGPTPDELERTRNQRALSMLQGLESLQDRATMLNRYHYHVGRPDFLATHLAAYKAVDAAAVKAAAATLNVERRAVVRVLPEPAAAGGN